MWKNVGHGLKNLDLSENSSPPWCPKLVTRLVSRHGIFFLICSSRFSCSTLFPLSCPTFAMSQHLAWIYDIRNLRYEAHCFLQHSRKTAFTTTKIAFLADVQRLDYHLNILYALQLFCCVSWIRCYTVLRRCHKQGCGVVRSRRFVVGSDS